MIDSDPGARQVLLVHDDAEAADARDADDGSVDDSDNDRKEETRMACYSGQCSVSMNLWLICAEYDKPCTEYDCVASIH